MSGSVTLLAVGDIAPRRVDLGAMFDLCRDTLAKADLVFGQLEAPLSDRGSPAPQARLAMRCPPATAAALAEAGVDVVSFAGNHCLDWGPDSLGDTLRHVAEAGVALCGAGRNETEARAPAVLIANDVSVAFLAYSAILPQAYEATDRRGGCAPLRVHTLYEPVEHDQPGTPGRVHTFCAREDLEALRLDVAKAKESADRVIVSIHWGIHFVPHQIADYQRHAAHAAIEAGADAILGHHPHILKGIEIYRGRPIVYSLGNFAIEQPQAFADNLFETRGFQEIAALNPQFDTRRAYIAPPDTQKSMIASLSFGLSGPVRAAFQPVMIGDDARPEPLAGNDPRFDAVAGYVRAAGRSQGLASRFERDGDLMLVYADEGAPS